ncbi:hypothetical protein Barb7_01446 [Bacteroidales bacterium Barb7]|nr:hypothetical protein Barb7_01446 [Bacteroidales bacterium Barb7]
MYNTICEYRICYLGDLMQLPSILPKESKRLRKGTLPDAVNSTVSIFAPVKTGSFFLMTSTPERVPNGIYLIVPQKGKETICKKWRIQQGKQLK